MRSKLLPALLLLACAVLPAHATVTPSAPPTRPTINAFEIKTVHAEAGTLSADIEVRAGAVVMGTVAVTVNAGSCIGLRYKSGGDVEQYTRADPSITIAAAFNAFANTAGNFATRAAALEAWLQGGGRLCLPN